MVEEICLLGNHDEKEILKKRRKGREEREKGNLSLPCTSQVREAPD